RYEAEIAHAMEALKPIGFELAQQLLAAMKVPHAAIEGYGKGAIVGSAGELEHGALWHVPGGYAMRELLEKNGVPTNAIVPSTKKVGAPSTALDVPLTHVNASYVRSHFDAIEVRVPGAPSANEIVYILAMSTGQRVHARVGGLAKEAIVGKDGLR
ncbi:MAG TPA: amino acid synthesis family protein, partial [Paraburkholderia sp.]|nr:amino acid synthesis family protein [Paraburkholderia sp.]